jgi:hypothetical protein
MERVKGIETVVSALSFEGGEGRFSTVTTLIARVPEQSRLVLGIILCYRK